VRKKHAMFVIRANPWSKKTVPCLQPTMQLWSTPALRPAPLHFLLPRERSCRRHLPEPWPHPHPQVRIQRLHCVAVSSPWGGISLLPMFVTNEVMESVASLVRFVTAGPLDRPPDVELSIGATHWVIGMALGSAAQNEYVSGFGWSEYSDCCSPHNHPQSLAMLH